MSIIFVLVFNRGYFGWQTICEVVDQSLKPVKNSNNLFLQFKWGNGYRVFS